jgi:hypothetical protein
MPYAMAQAEPFDDFGLERIDDEQVHGGRGRAALARAGCMPEFNDPEDCK